MKIKKIFCSMALTGIMLISGCASFPEMTEAQREEIVEYAAGLVIQNMKDYDSRLVDLSLYADLEEVPEETPQPESGGMDAVADTDKVDIGSGEEYGNIDSLLAPEGVTLTYNGYSVEDTYPNDDSGEPFFALDASPGNKLLVLNFTLVNTTEEEQMVDIMGENPVCTIIVNDTEKKHTLSTMLLDDLSTYEGNLGAGEELSLVLLTEIDASASEQIESIKMKVAAEKGTVITLLQ